MIIKAILIAGFIICCLWIISEGINQNLEKELKNQKEINKKIIETYQLEHKAMYDFLKMIKMQLEILKMKNISKEQFKKIPFEVINWIDNLLKQVEEDDE